MADIDGWGWGTPAPKKIYSSFTPFYAPRADGHLLDATSPPIISAVRHEQTPMRLLPPLLQPGTQSLPRGMSGCEWVLASEQETLITDEQAETINNDETTSKNLIRLPFVSTAHIAFASITASAKGLHTTDPFPFVVCDANGAPLCDSTEPGLPENSSARSAMRYRSLFFSFSTGSRGQNSAISLGFKGSLSQKVDSVVIRVVLLEAVNRQFFRYFGAFTSISGARLPCINCKDIRLMSLAHKLARRLPAEVLAIVVSYIAPLHIKRTVEVSSERRPFENKVPLHEMLRGSTPFAAPSDDLGPAAIYRRELIPTNQDPECLVVDRSEYSTDIDFRKLGELSPFSPFSLRRIEKAASFPVVFGQVSLKKPHEDASHNVCSMSETNGFAAHVSSADNRLGKRVVAQLRQYAAYHDCTTCDDSDGDFHDEAIATHAFSVNSPHNSIQVGVLFPDPEDYPLVCVAMLEKGNGNPAIHVIADAKGTVGNVWATQRISPAKLLGVEQAVTGNVLEPQPSTINWIYSLQKGAHARQVHSMLSYGLPGFAASPILSSKQSPPPPVACCLGTELHASTLFPKIKGVLGLAAELTNVPIFPDQSGAVFPLFSVNVNGKAVVTITVEHKFMRACEWTLRLNSGGAVNVSGEGSGLGGTETCIETCTGTVSLGILTNFSAGTFHSRGGLQGRAQLEPLKPMAVIRKLRVAVFFDSATDTLVNNLMGGIFS